MNEKLAEILNNVNPEILENPGVDLVEEGILDSFAIMQVIGELESAFGFDFEPEDIVQENFCNMEAMQKILGKYGVKP